MPPSSLRLGLHRRFPISDFLSGRVRFHCFRQDEANSNPAAGALLRAGGRWTQWCRLIGIGRFLVGEVALLTRRVDHLPLTKTRSY
jgi:hypothetical protein